MQSAHNHLNGSNCPKCATISSHKLFTLTTDQFIYKANLVHNNAYDYSLVNYINNYTKVKIICPKHGLFYQTPNNHLAGDGCPKCMLSKQYLLYQKLCTSFPNEQILFEATKRNIPWAGKMRFDIYFPKYNIAIEYNGKQHYKPIKMFGGYKEFIHQLYRDIKKYIVSKLHGCKIFYIRYNHKKIDYNNLINKLTTIINGF